MISFCLELNFVYVNVCSARGLSQATNIAKLYDDMGLYPGRIEPKLAKLF